MIKANLYNCALWLYWCTSFICYVAIASRYNIWYWLSQPSWAQPSPWYYCSLLCAVAMTFSWVIVHITRVIRQSASALHSKIRRRGSALAQCPSIYRCNSFHLIHCLALGSSLWIYDCTLFFMSKSSKTMSNLVLLRSFIWSLFQMLILSPLAGLTKNI